MEQNEQLEARQNHYENQAKKCRRIADHSLDPENRKIYAARAEANAEKAAELAEKLPKTVDNSGENGIIKPKEATLKINLQLFAHIPEEKFTKYALDPKAQPDKAKAFKNALGYTQDNFKELIENIREHFNSDLLVSKGKTKFGERFELVMELKGANGKTANVCTGWFKDTPTSEPRLTTAYVTKKEVTK